MSGRRPERIGEQIREEVSQIITGDLKDPRIGVTTVTDVKMSPDLKHARVFVTVMGSDDEVARSLRALNSAAGFVRWQLGRSLQLRYTPQLHFAFDKSVRTAARIEEILEEEASKLRERQVEPDSDKDNPTTLPVSADPAEE